MSSGNSPLRDKSNPSNPPREEETRWGLKRQTRDVLFGVYADWDVCVSVPQVKDHLLILVRGENMLGQGDMDSD